MNLQIFQLASEPILVLRSKQKDGGKKDERSTIEKLNQNPKSKKKEFSMNLDSVGHGNHNHWAGGNALALHESDMSSMYRLVWSRIYIPMHPHTYLHRSQSLVQRKRALMNLSWASSSTVLEPLLISNFAYRRTGTHTYARPHGRTHTHTYFTNTLTRRRFLWWKRHVKQVTWHVSPCSRVLWSLGA